MTSRFDDDFSAGAAIALDDQFGDASVTYTTAAGVASTIRATIDEPQRDLAYASVGQAERWMCEVHFLKTAMATPAINDKMTLPDDSDEWTVYGIGSSAGFFDVELEKMKHLTRSGPWQR